MVKRSVLIAALLVAILGALSIASATEDSGQTPETVVVPPGVVMPRDEPQETRTRVVTVTAYCPCEKCCGAHANGYTATGAIATQGVTIAADPDVFGAPAADLHRAAPGPFQSRSSANIG